MRCAYRSRGAAQPHSPSHVASIFPCVRAQVVLSPAVPMRLRGALRAAVLATIVAMGEYHSMSVMMWEDFDI